MAHAALAKDVGMVITVVTLLGMEVRVRSAMNLRFTYFFQ
jgi:hypothetical protein